MIYSISDLEQFSGVQSHTIRIWEQRYNALKPMRTEGNTRFYDDDQLKRLLNIVSLNQSGLKISKICSLSDEDISRLLQKELQSISETSNFEYYVTQLLKHGLCYDEFSFDNLLNTCISKFGILESYKNIMYPILVRLGLMWRKDDICPAQEHFLSNIIRRKIHAAIDNLPLNENANQTWLLFLPEDEDHEIGLLFANYILKANGKKVIFLGSKVPLDSIKKVVEQNDIDSVLFFMVRSRAKKAAQKYIEDLEKICSSIKIYFAGNAYGPNQLKLGKKINQINSLQEFENKVQNLPVL
ncbi:MerR family transcriptional regulator [Pedobacter jamesrossensis]|uniref:MerR family transcriptional regulator n=1 Tax=Pedobacter jamesrossensis TaxID=1908238 RepID=A0ABV8NL22_9SPHI